MVDWNNCTECGAMMDWRSRGKCDDCRLKPYREEQRQKKFQQRYEEELDYQRWKKEQGYT